MLEILIVLNEKDQREGSANDSKGKEEKKHLFFLSE